MEFEYNKRKERWHKIWDALETPRKVFFGLTVILGLFAGAMYHNQQERKNWAKDMSVSYVCTDAPVERHPKILGEMGLEEMRADPKFRKAMEKYELRKDDCPWLNSKYSHDEQ